MTTITLPITAAQEAAFTASARERGLDLGAYVLSLLLKNEDERRVPPRSVPPQTADDEAEAGKAEIYALAAEMREYESAVARGETIPEDVKRRMQPQPGAGAALVRAMHQMQERAARAGASEMTLEEINAEIAAARRERRERKLAAVQ